MGRLLLVVTLVLPLGCGSASKSPVAEGETPPAAGAEKTGKTAAKTAAPEPTAKPSEAKPPRPFAELDPPDVAGPEPEPSLKAEPKSTRGKTEIDLPHIRLTAPGTWVAKKPDTDILLAEFALPRAAGDPADGRVTVAMAGSGVKQTLAMWRESFGGKPDKETQEELQILGVWASLTDMSGTYRTRPSQSAPLASFPNYRMLAATCDVGVKDQMYFIKAVGPAKTIAAHEKEFRAFLASMKPKQ